MLKKSFLVILISLFLFVQSFAQSEIQSILGWKMTKELDLVSMSPRNLFAGSKTFTYNILKVEKYNKLPVDWFAKFVEDDLKKMSWGNTDKIVIQEAQNIKNYTGEFTDASQKKVYVLYLGYVFDQNSVRMAKMFSNDRNYFQLNFQPATRHFFNLSVKDRAVSTGQNLPNSSGGGASNPVNPNRTISSQGSVKAGDISSVVIHLEYSYGIGGAVYPEYVPYVLFKNGDIYEEPNVSLWDLDVSLSKAKEPKKWGVWRNNNGTLSITWTARTGKNRTDSWDADSIKPTNSPKKGEKIDGSFLTLSGGGNTALGGDTITYASNTIRFNSNGQFTLAKSSGATTSSTTAYSGRTDAGTYTLDNYTLELRFNNGKVERSFFYFYPDKRDVFGIGAKVFTPRK
jgi:hypothetical protein